MNFKDDTVYERDQAVKKAKKRKKARRKKQTAAIFIVIFLVALITLVILSLTVFFKTEEIRVEGSVIYTAQEIISCAEIKKGDNLFLIPDSKISERLQRELPFISEVKITREFPSAVKISIKETKEEICFVTMNGIYSANRDGKIIKQYEERPENLIMITVSDKVKMQTGRKISFETEREAEIFGLYMQRTEESGYDVDFVNISDPYSTYMKIDGRIIVKFGSSAYFENKSAYLEASLDSVSDNAVGVFDLSAWTPKNNKTVLTYCDISEYEK